MIDLTKADVTELAYVNREIWQGNSHGLWWNKAAHRGCLSAALYVDRSRHRGFYIDNPAGDFAVIDVGELTALPEGGLGIAPQSTPKS